MIRRSNMSNPNPGPITVQQLKEEAYERAAQKTPNPTEASHNGHYSSGMDPLAMT